MLEHVAELVGLDDLEVDLHPRVREHARAGVARGVHGLDHRQLGERGGERGRVLGGRDDVEVLDRVGLAAQRARHLDALGGRVRAQRADDLVGDGLRAREQDARRGPPSGVSASALSSVSSTFAPKPRSPRIFCCSAAARSASSESTPSSS